MTTRDSPSDIVASILAAGNIDIARPLAGSPNARWQVTTGNIPPQPVDRVSLADMSPTMFGYNQRSKQMEGAAGVIVYLRANKYNEGWEKCWQIKTLLDAVQNQIVVRNGRTYKVRSLRLTSGPMFIGQEEGQTASNFTINYTMTLTQES